MNDIGWQPETRCIVKTRYGQMRARLRGIGGDGTDTAAAALEALDRLVLRGRFDLLAERPGAAYEAVFRYDGAGRLHALRVPVVASAPRDDVYDVTLRSRPLRTDARGLTMGT
jgi:hypothetical protein